MPVNRELLLLEVKQEIENMISKRIDSVVHACISSGIDPELAVRSVFQHNMHCVGERIAEYVLGTSGEKIEVSDYSRPGDIVGALLVQASTSKIKN